MEVSDPSLEDLATLHLDLLASQKGYQRPVPNPWNTKSLPYTPSPLIIILVLKDE